MTTIRWLVGGGVVALLAAGCATVSEGDRVPSPANAPLGGPRLDETAPDASTRAWGINLLDVFRSRDMR
jgi:hypothetical protein